MFHCSFSDRMCVVLVCLVVLFVGASGQRGDVSSSSNITDEWPLWPNCRSSPNCSFFDPVTLGAGTTLVFAGAAVCSGAGIGGGGVFVPTFILLFGLNAHWALPLSQVTIFGVGIGSVVYLLPQRHPTMPGRRLIDLNLAALLEPATLAGTIPGVLLNIVFPAYLITIFLAVLLGVTTAITLRKGLKQRQEEKTLLQRGEERASLLKGPDAGSVQAGGKLDDVLEERQTGSEAAHDGVWKWWQLGGLFACAAALALFSVLKILFVCESVPYWVFFCAPLPVCLLLAYFFARQPPKRGNHSWVWSAAGFVAGLAAAFLGIGGGMVKSPLMIHMRTTPQVATATASFMIVFTAASTTLEFFLLGRLVWQYAVWFGVAGLLGSFVGQYGVARVIKYFGKQSLVSFLVAAIIGGCAVTLVATNILEMLHGAKMGFATPCSEL